MCHVLQQQVAREHRLIILEAMGVHRRRHLQAECIGHLNTPSRWQGLLKDLDKYDPRHEEGGLQPPSVKGRARMGKMLSSRPAKSVGRLSARVATCLDICSLTLMKGPSLAEYASRVSGRECI
mmetsp:Transcript_10587/g.20444  ORF Transcript_10587/g.20444 Transcript_10587/m.20444 type:complete len:123 (-) Transcript_10587:1214-1582(-)